MKRKIKVFVVLALVLSLSACGTKLFKSKGKTVKEEDITRPPPIAVSKDKDVRVRSNPDEAVSFEEWSKQNTPSGAAAE